MFGAIPRYAAGDDLAPFGDEVSQQLRVLVIQNYVLVRAKPANFPALVWP